MHPIIDFLTKQAHAVRQLEANADQALHQKHNQEAYRDQLLEKAELLSKLPENAQDLLQDLDPELAGEVRTELQGFAQRAEKALELNSVFFMRQLLYPDDYQDGGFNRLETFVRDLEARL
mgnify:FL=1